MFGARLSSAACEEGLHNLIPFLQAKQAVVDEHANKLIADRAVQQGCHHGGIHAPERPSSTLPDPTLPTDRFDGVVHGVCAAVQRAWQLHTSRRKRRSILYACFVWVTSGWNCTP